MNWIQRFFSSFKSSIKNGFFPFRLLSPAPQFNQYTEESEKLLAVFSNFALLKVITLQCDLFSLAKVYVYNSQGTLVKNDPAYDRLAEPNPFQSQTQFLWDYMFWKMLGNAYLYMESDIVERDNAPMYWLETNKIEWPLSIERSKDKLILSKSALSQLMSTEIVYRYEDGSVLRFPLSKLMHISDLTNGVGNWFKGFSRIESLTKIINNLDTTLDSKNINTRYTGKFLVAGTQDPKDVSKKPMSQEEKEDIERKFNGDTWKEKMEGEKQVHGVKSMVDIKRFVDDLRVLELDKSLLADFFLIGSMYNIPRDVLELYASSTFENQEKARAGHVSYTLEPAGEVFGSMMAKRWKYPNGWKICLSWDHLPFVQVFEKDRVDIQNKKILAFSNLVRIGVPIDEINIFLDTEFSIDEKLREQNNSGGNKSSHV